MNVVIRQENPNILVWEDIPESHKRILEEIDALVDEVRIDHYHSGGSDGNIPCVMMSFTFGGLSIDKRVDLRQDGSIHDGQNGACYSSVQLMWDSFCEEQSKRDLIVEGREAHEKAARIWNDIVADDAMRSLVDRGQEGDNGCEIEGQSDWYEGVAIGECHTREAQYLHFSPEVSACAEREEQVVGNHNWIDAENAIQALAAAHRAAVVSMLV